MTRNERIFLETIRTSNDCFAEGAHWADEHLDFKKLKSIIIEFFKTNDFDFGETDIEYLMNYIMTNWNILK